MAVRSAVVATIFAGIMQSAFSQAITFNSPLPWVSLRNDTIVVRAQADTALLRNKTLTLKLSSVKNGRKSVISTKSFPIDDPSGEFSFGSIRKKLVGGEEFLRISWETKSPKGAKKDSTAVADEKGTIEPIGIADLSAIGPADTVAAVKVGDKASLTEAAAKIGENLRQTGKISYGMAWNKDALFIVVKKATENGSVHFAFDGKSGKNAFLSYPDRIVSCSFADSVTVKGIHYERLISKDSLHYKEQVWRNEITHEASGDRLLVRVPWFDTGMIPFEDRTIGFGVFVTDEKGKTIAATPASAQFYIPATWGMLLLQK